VLASQLEHRSADGGFLLHENFFRNMELKKERVQPLEAESQCTAAELTDLQEHGIEVGQELRKILPTERGGE
jgi:hypothetical protein